MSSYFKAIIYYLKTCGPCDYNLVLKRPITEVKFICLISVLGVVSSSKKT